MPPVILSSDSHVFEPPDLWQTCCAAPDMGISWVFFLKNY